MEVLGREWKDELDPGPLSATPERSFLHQLSNPLASTERLASEDALTPGCLVEQVELPADCPDGFWSAVPQEHSSEIERPQFGRASVRRGKEVRDSAARRVRD